MSDVLWETIRAAVATKIATSSIVAAAGLRSCDTDTDEPLAGGPLAKVLPPFVDGIITRTNANREDYELQVPVEVIVPRPSGTQRSSPVTSVIVRAIQLEWRTGIYLGLSPTLGETYIGTISPGLEEYAESGQDGARIIIVCTVSETFTERTG